MTRIPVVAAAPCYSPVVSATTTLHKPQTVRHLAVVRVTHWITVATFFALLVSGAAIVFAHPRFYWGEVGNVMTRPLFTLPIPASRATVPTKYGYVLHDQNGWSRSLHFQAAWASLLAGLIYVIWSLRNGHFRKDVLPRRADWTLETFKEVISSTLRRQKANEADAHSYNGVQRILYLVVIFVLFPLIIWTGLAMSPAVTAAVPLAADALGGRQSARTLHFLVSGLLLMFVVVHVLMVSLAGFGSRMRAMITGRVMISKERR